MSARPVCDCGKPADVSFVWHGAWVHVCLPCYKLHPVWDEDDL